MKRRTRIGILAALFPLVLDTASFTATARVEAAGRTKAPFTILISTDTPTIRPGGMIILHIRVIDISTQVIQISRAFFEGVDSSFAQQIWDKTGKFAARNDTAERDDALAGHVRLRTLKPSEALETSTRLSRKYEIREPGRYFIQLSRQVSTKVADGIVKSNRLEITVTP